MIDLKHALFENSSSTQEKERSTIIVLQFLIFADKIRLVTVVIVTKIRAKTALTASAMSCLRLPYQSTVQ